MARGPLNYRYTKCVDGIAVLVLVLVLALASCTGHRSLLSEDLATLDGWEREVQGMVRRASLRRSFPQLGDDAVTIAELSSYFERVEEEITAAPPWRAHALRVGFVAQGILPATGWPIGDLITRPRPRHPAWRRWPSALVKVSRAASQKDSARLLRQFRSRGEFRDLRPFVALGRLATACGAGDLAGVAASREFVRMDADANAQSQHVCDPGDAAYPGRLIAPALKSRLELRDQETHCTLVVFWSDWCGPCIPELLRIRAVRSLVERGELPPINIVGVMVESQAGSDDVIESRLGDVWDRSISVAQVDVATYLPLGVPEAVLFGKDGRVIASSEMVRGENLALTVQRSAVMCGAEVSARPF